MTSFASLSDSLYGTRTEPRQLSRRTLLATLIAFTTCGTFLNQSKATDFSRRNKLRSWSLGGENNSSTTSDRVLPTPQSQRSSLSSRKVQDVNLQLPDSSTNSSAEHVTLAARNRTASSSSASLAVPPATAATAATTAESNTVLDFVHHEGVVIATKVHGWPAHIVDVKQMLCLLTAAYNNRTRYDIVVFTTVAWSANDVTELEQIVHPARVRVVVDSPPLRDVIGNLSDFRRDRFLKRCKLTGLDDPRLNWERGCDDGAIRYNWQAEFRAQHIWNMPEIRTYKYMVWVDADAFAAGVWQQDPVAEMIRHDLVLLFDNFPGGTSRGPGIQKRITNAYNKTICSIQAKDGHLEAKEGPPGCGNSYQQVHGFFHISNIKFYQSHQFWFDILIGVEKLVRRYDDQIGITVPAALAAPDRAWDMYARGIRLDVTHNRFFDGKPGRVSRRYKRWWSERASKDFPEARHCARLIISDGR